MTAKQMIEKILTPSQLFCQLRARAGQSKRGQGLVEFALILPLLLLVVLGIVEFGYIFAVYSGMFNAAREGARYGVVEPKDVVGIVSHTREKIILADPDGASIVVAYDRGPNTPVFNDTTQVQLGDRVLVQVQYDLPTITPVIQPIISQLPIETQSARTIVSLGEAVAWNPQPGGGGGGGGGGDPDPTDTDGDGIPDESDNCPATFNPDQADTDDDGLGDACDNCPLVYNPDQVDGNGNGIGDACEVAVSIIASVNPETVESGEEAVFSYLISNIGIFDLTGVVIEDTLGNTINVGDLTAGASGTWNVSHVITETTTSIATVTGVDVEQGSTASDTDSVTVDVAGPGIDLTVTASALTVSSGEIVTLTYTVQNSGDYGLDSLNVWDNLGASFTYGALDMGQTVFWRVPYRVYSTTLVYVSAEGVSAEGTATDNEGVTINVVEAFDPIVIQEPILAGATVVTGTAHAGATVYIRDLMSDTFPSTGVTVQADGVFEFASLPPLLAGHVIVVEGYNEWDSALVGAADGDFEPIDIDELNLCHGDYLVGGMAEPEQFVTLVITDTGMEDRTRVNASGYFSFTLPDGQPLQAGQAVGVHGYGESDSAAVRTCSADPYVAISPQCSDASPPDLTISVDGGFWLHGNNYTLVFCWNGDGDADCWVARDKNPTSSFTGLEYSVPVVDGVNTLTARLYYKYGNKTQESLEQEATTTLLSPCPSPNLLVSDMQLLTSEPISTYQALDYSVTVVNTGTRPVNNLFWVDLFTAEPLTDSTGVAWAAVNGLGAKESTTLSVTLQSGFELTGTYDIWSLADSWDQVSESNEDDNVGGPITTTVALQGTPPPTMPVTTTVGAIAGETRVSLDGSPLPHGRTNVYVYEGTELLASTVSNSNARYTVDNLPVGSYTVLGETWIDGVRYSKTYHNVAVNEDETTVLIIIMYES